MLLLSDQKRISNIFDEEYYKTVYELGFEYLAQLILRMLIGCGFGDESIPEFFSAKELIRILHLSPKSRYPLDWILRYLANSDYLYAEKRKNDYYFKKKKKNFIPNPEKLRKLILQTSKDMKSSCDFMEYVCKHYVEFLKGDLTGEELLFVKNKMICWNEYFNNSNKGYAVYNQLGSLGLRKWFPQERDEISFLEIGVGTGSATVMLLQELIAEKLTANIVRYIISDISPMFVRLAKKNIKESILSDMPIETMRVDLNQSLSEKSSMLNEIDVIYGVNSLHVAYDIMATTKEIFRILRPGGLLVISECIRESKESVLIQELILNVLESYIDVKIDDYYRTTPGFLTKAEWIRIFEKTGFEDIECITNIDVDTKERHYPEHALVIKGKKC